MSQVVLDPTDRLTRVWSRKRAYARMVLRNGTRVGLAGYLRTEFPRLLPDAAIPPFVSVELTNTCNLRCTYCRVHVDQRPPGEMDDRTFDNLVREIKAAGCRRVRLVGDGESTKHPKFKEYVRKIGQAAPFVELKTNGQLLDESTIDAILAAPVRQVNVSVDSDNREGYERSRVDGSFERLLANLQLLKRMRDDRGGSTLINIILMARPSDRGRERRMLRFWRSHADTAVTNPVFAYTGLDPDVYAFPPNPEGYPFCIFPFKDFEVHYDGNVPMCAVARILLAEKDDFSVGNINTHTIDGLWNGEVMKQYRLAHRKRRPELMPFCKGCCGQ